MFLNSYANACDFNTTWPLAATSPGSKGYATVTELNWQWAVEPLRISWLTWLRPVKFTLFLESKESVRQEPVQYSKNLQKYWKLANLWAPPLSARNLDLVEGMQYDIYLFWSSCILWYIQINFLLLHHDLSIIDRELWYECKLLCARLSWNSIYLSWPGPCLLVVSSPRMHPSKDDWMWARQWHKGWKVWSWWQVTYDVRWRGDYAARRYSTKIRKCQQWHFLRNSEAEEGFTVDFTTWWQYRNFSQRS